MFSLSLNFKVEVYKLQIYFYDTANIEKNTYTSKLQ